MLRCRLTPVRFAALEQPLLICRMKPGEIDLGSSDQVTAWPAAGHVARQLTKGKMVYDKYACAECHGRSGAAAADLRRAHRSGEPGRHAATASGHELRPPRTQPAVSRSAWVSQKLIPMLRSIAIAWLRAACVSSLRPSA